MKNLRLVTTVVCLLFVTSAIQAQHKVKEKDLIGNWKMIIDVEDAFKEAKQDMEGEDSILGKIVLSSVSGLVTGILDELDIYMEFKPKGELKIIVDAFGETEVEYSRWSIDKQGRLFIDDTKTYSSDDEDYWLFQDDLLMSMENKKANKSVYMVRID